MHEDVDSQGRRQLDPEEGVSARSQARSLSKLAAGRRHAHLPQLPDRSGREEQALMNDRFIAPRTIPSRAGVGLKAEHYRSILETWPDIGFFEVHAENYMGAGGPPHRYLSEIRSRYPLSLHGVGLSIGAERPL